MDFFTFHKLRYNLPGNTRFVEESASLKPGDILIIKGPSGIGKTTLLKVLARLLKADGGSITFRGQDWKTYPPQDWRCCIQYVPQHPVWFDGSLEHNLGLPFALRAVQRRSQWNPRQLYKYLQHLQLNSQLLTQPARTLSGGEGLRAGLMRSLLLNPDILLLDEPTAALDRDAKAAVLNLLEEWVVEKPDRAVIMVSHQDEDVVLRHCAVLTMAVRKEFT